MKNVTKTNALFAFIVVFYLFCSYFLAALPWSLPFSFQQILPELILLIPCIFYVFLMNPETVKDISYGAVSFGTIVKVIVITYLLMPTMMFINGLSSIFVDNKVVDLMSQVMERPLWFKIATMALAPAIVEEFVFRGLIFHGLKKRNPFWAILVSAFLFGAIHMNFNQFLYAFVIGTFFAMMTYATGSMWPSMLMHFIINGQSVVLSHFIMKYGADMLETVESTSVTASEVNEIAMINAYLIVYGTLLAIAVLGLFLASKVYFSICRKNRGEENVKRIFSKPFRKTFEESQGKFIDGYFILAVGLCILHMILGEIG